MTTYDSHSPAVLVTFGSRNGSTASIANIIANTLRSEGLQVEMYPAGEVRDIRGYNAVVVGGALYANRWHRDARRFVRRNAKQLRRIPVWLFSSGPLDSSADAGEIAPVPQAAAAMGNVGAREHMTFGGRLDDTASGFLARAMVRNGKGGDFRNPQRIMTWAKHIAHSLTAAAL